MLNERLRNSLPKKETTAKFINPGQQNYYSVNDKRRGDSREKAHNFSIRTQIRNGTNKRVYL